MRAVRILQNRPERAIVALAELCEERKDEELVVAPPYGSRPPTLPPQTPYTVGSQTLRPKVTERFSPPAQFFEPGPRQVIQPVSLRPPPDHMAPKRGKWTSPPPPEAPSADHSLFESQLGKGLQLATASSDAREKDTAYNSESNSEVFTDEGSDMAEDDLRSVRSYNEGSPNNFGLVRRPSWHTQETTRAQTTLKPLPSATSSRSSSTIRGRFTRTSEKSGPSPPTAFRSPPSFDTSTSRPDNRRSLSGPPRSLRPSLSSNMPTAMITPLPPSPQSPMDPSFSENTNVFYQTTTTRSPRPTALYPIHGTHLTFLSHYPSHSGYMGQIPQDILPTNQPPALTSMNPRAAAGFSNAGQDSGGPDTPTPSSYSKLHHSHSLSNSTITALTPPPTVSKFVSPLPSPLSSSRSHDTGSSHSMVPPNACVNPTRSISVHAVHPNEPMPTGKLKLPQEQENGTLSPQPSAGDSIGSSPTHSSTGYSTSISRSPSPASPLPPPPVTAVPLKQKEDAMSLNASFSELAMNDGNISSRSGTFVVRVEQSRDDEKGLGSC